MTITAEATVVRAPAPLKASELTIDEYVCLRTVAQRGDYHFHDIAKKFNSNLINRLIHGGVIAKAYSASLGSHYVHPTPHGQIQLANARGLLGITSL